MHRTCVDEYDRSVLIVLARSLDGAACDLREELGRCERERLRGDWHRRREAGWQGAGRSPVDAVGPSGARPRYLLPDSSVPQVSGNGGTRPSALLRCYGVIPHSCHKSLSISSGTSRSSSSESQRRRGTRCTDLIQTVQPGLTLSPCPYRDGRSPMSAWNDATPVYLVIRLLFPPSLTVGSACHSHLLFLF